MTYNKSSMVAVEVTIGSGKIAVAIMPATEYIKLRQMNALGKNNCFLPDEEGAARWAARAINHYKGWDRSGVRIVPIPTMTTRSYQGRWQDFELAVCKVLNLEHIGFEARGVKGYVPDAVDTLGLCWEIKSRRGMYRKGQVKKH
jgi:hypothetical protein